MKKTMSKKSLILALIALVVVVGAFVGIWAATRPETQVGDKTITVTVVHKDAAEKDFEINTDAEMLRGALEQEEGLLAGEESQYGLFVKTVNGITVDDSKQQWWCFTKGGEDLFTGVDTTPISDGDKFEITLKTGY